MLERKLDAQKHVNQTINQLFLLELAIGAGCKLAKLLV